MAQKPPVHVEPRKNGWAVVREGSGRASSVHPTQSEAAKEGRDIARYEATEFFLHAQDGRVREHRDYAEAKPSAEKGVVGQAAEAARAVTEGTSAAATHAVGAASGAPRAAGSDADQKLDEPGSATSAGSDDVITSDEETSDTEKPRGLTDAESNDRFGAPGERYSGYEVYDNEGERIGKLDDLFVDENDDLEYVGVRSGLSDARSALIPAAVVTIDDKLRRMVVPCARSVVAGGPSLGNDEEVTPDFEERVHDHYGLTSPRSTADRSGYGAYYPGEERAGREHSDSGTAVPGAQTLFPEAEQVRGGARDQERLTEPNVPEDELRVQRSEEELEVGTREREAGAVRVGKRVRTDRERILVPKKRVEVTVERVPVEEGATSTASEATGSKIGEDEIVVPVVEEEVVVEKRPVVKEEIRIRKDVVEETQVVEEDVRREEVEVDDET